MNEPMTSAPIRSAPAFHARCRLPSQLLADTESGAHARLATHAAD
ncbi:MAG: hypothetical protein ACYDHY_12605 [Acidiferrobacterales bacterium]